MMISIAPTAWINARVARGDFASAQEAARQLIDERIAERTLEEQDDLAWAKPHVDEALAEVARRSTGRAEGVMARLVPSQAAWARDIGPRSCQAAVMEYIDWVECDLIETVPGKLASRHQGDAAPPRGSSREPEAGDRTAG
jgi:antitoxin ParD1/3/4